MEEEEAAYCPHSRNTCAGGVDKKMNMYREEKEEKKSDSADPFLHDTFSWTHLPPNPPSLPLLPLPPSARLSRLTGHKRDSSEVQE